MSKHQILCVGGSGNFVFDYLQGTLHYGLGGVNKGRLFYNRKKDALEWTNKFENVYSQGIRSSSIGDNRDVKVSCVLAVSPTTVARAKSFLRNEYYGNGRRPLNEWRSWVDVPHPFNLMDFSWRLLLDFHSDDPQAKEAAAVGLMEGKDPIQECREFFHNKEEFLVIIDGLRSTQHWDMIKATYLSEPIKCTVVVITNKAEVAVHCERDTNKNAPDFILLHLTRTSVPNVLHFIKVWLSLVHV